MADELRETLDLSRLVVGLHRDGEARLVPSASGPPARIEGYTVGAPILTKSPPHGGERHPDGDELLFLVSGNVTVLLEEGGGERRIEMEPGQSVVVRRGVWHRALVNEPSQLFHITPGPGGEHRPLRETRP